MSELLNNQFMDDKGRTWTFNITVGTYRKIKAEEGIDVTDVFSDNNWLERVASGEDVSILLTLALLSLQNAMAEREVSMDDLCDSLGGDAMEDMAKALIGGVVNFMPEHKRKPLVKIVELLHKEKQRAGDVVTSKLSSMAPAIEAESKKLETQLDELINSRLEKLKSSSSKPQESSE